MTALAPGQFSSWWNPERRLQAAWEPRVGIVKKPKRPKGPLPVIGWREWVSLPQLELARVKAKVDTGARSSSLHAFGVKEFERDGAPWVSFSVHPTQRDSAEVVHTEAKILDYRMVRSSSGVAQRRPVIVTDIRLGDFQWSVELTLARRDTMGFRMLLGREAIRRRFLVDAGQSYLIGTKQKKQ